MIDISIVIPTYNRAAFIAEAIKSCYVAADGLNIEIVVVDDASTDSSEMLIKQYPVTYIQFERNRGRCAARNVGQENSLGRYVKFLDSDDTLEPGSLRKEYELAEETAADMVLGGWHVAEITSQGQEVLTHTYLPPIFDNNVDCVLAGKAVPTSAALYRRGYIEGVQWVNVGPLDDWDYFIHAALEGGKTVSLPEAVYRWRQHPGERVSGQAMLVTAQCFYRILDRLYDLLNTAGQLTEVRKKRLAQYYYKELRVLFRYNPKMGREIEQKIFILDPKFVPRDEERSSIIRLLARVIPLHWLLVSYGVMRRRLDKLRNA
jgi:glycosyltransferase involved in cell wall biosynthesis